MKPRLQALWDEVVPDGGPCPQPDVKKVQRRVDAALDSRPRAVSRRALRLGVLAIAAVLLTGAALAVGEELELIPPEFNVLSNNFGWGGDPETAIAMMTITPVSVEDDNYTMTVTSSLADGNKLYFTLTIEPKNDEARERLQVDKVFDLLVYRFPGTGSIGFSGNLDDETGAVLIDISATWIPAKSTSVRFDLMDRGIWLTFPVKTARTLTLKVDAETPGISNRKTTAGPVTVDRLEISPLSYTLRFTASDLGTYPLPYFLFHDGSMRTMSQLKVLKPSGGSSSAMFDQHLHRFKYTWQFGSIQDLSLMESIVLGGMAYPLDGGDPYEVDISGIPQPFAIPIGDRLEDSGMGWAVPLFALCEGLGADCRWDEAAGVAVASFRDTTLTFTLGSKTIQLDGQWGQNTIDAKIPPVYRDGELWVDAAVQLRAAWSIDLTWAVEDEEDMLVVDNGFVVFTHWLVNP